MNKTERVIRIIAGIAVIGAGVTYGSWWGIVGLMPLVTGLAGRCPAYLLTGKKSCDVS